MVLAEERASDKHVAGPFYVETFKRASLVIQVGHRNIDTYPEDFTGSEESGSKRQHM